MTSYLVLGLPRVFSPSYVDAISTILLILYRLWVPISTPSETHRAQPQELRPPFLGAWRNGVPPYRYWIESLIQTARSQPQTLAVLRLQTVPVWTERWIGYPGPVPATWLPGPVPAAGCRAGHFSENISGKNPKIFPKNSENCSTDPRDQNKIPQKNSKKFKKNAKKLSALFRHFFSTFPDSSNTKSTKKIRHYHLWYWFFKARPPVSIKKRFDMLPWQFLRKWALSVFYALLGEVLLKVRKTRIRLIFLKSPTGACQIPLKSILAAPPWKISNKDDGFIKIWLNYFWRIEKSRKKVAKRAN